MSSAKPAPTRISLTTRLVIAMVAVTLLSILLMIVLPLYVFRSRLETLPPNIRRDVERILDNPDNFAVLQDIADNPRGFERRMPETLRRAITSRWTQGRGNNTPTSPAGEPSSPASDPASSQEGRLLRQRVLESFRDRLNELETIADDIRAERSRNLLLSALTACLVAAIIAVLVARRIAKPVRSVAHAAQQLSDGDLSARATLTNPSDLETELLAQNFNHMAETLEQQEDERSTMIANIAHELRTPLAVMSARLTALEDGVLALDGTEVARLQRHTQRLTRLVDDLRTLSLFDAGRLSLERTPLDLRDVLDNVVDDASKRADDVNLVLDVPDDPLWIEGDSYRLEQVFSNLVGNALRHATATNLSVHIQAQQPTPAEVLVQVTDSGAGLSEEALNRAFDRFYSSQASQGGGLGLAIVETLVKLHGGRVSAANTPAGGAQFTVHLPSSLPEHHNLKPDASLVDASRQVA